ncbi:hypothetical protein LCGC14_1862140 [marine sediment metagenome]|uniref:Uncharacterized protein n=1 Tax=marine sediment metagenome TaxID=412755 RepID=A0A0F9J662_9ZZZZ
MELYPKRKTDEQYVEAVRKLVARSRWFGVYHACLVIVFVVAFQILWRSICSVDGLMSGVSKGVHIGIMLGAMAGVLMVLAAQNVIWGAQCFKGHRTERLMLKFHDELKKEKELPTAESKATSG